EALFDKAFAIIDEQKEMREEQFPVEVRVLATEDYAVTWGVFYYIKNIRDIYAIRQAINAAILAESVRANIALSTPMLQQVDMTSAPPNTDFSNALHAQ
ncbi:MAG: hypothetical protein AAF512_16205, partial [Pseudomonadota bacterium]